MRSWSLTPSPVRLPVTVAAKDTGGPTICAAVCTRGRLALMQRAVQSLLAQSIPLAEIVVVDHAGRGERSAASSVDSLPGVRYLRERRTGLDVARNAALAHATADVVAFLDDDAVADRDWARHLRATFRDEAVAATTGRVEALSLGRSGQRLFEANGGFSRGRKRIELPRDARGRLHGRRAPLIAWAVSIVSGSSLAVRRDAALSIGGFDEALDRGPALPGGGHHDMMWRLLRAGNSVVYEPASLAWHEHRVDEADAVAQIGGHQRGLIAFLVKSLRRAAPAEAFPIAAFLAWRMVKPGVRLVRRAVGRDPITAGGLAVMWVECVRGLGQGAGTWSHARTTKL